MQSRKIFIAALFLILIFGCGRKADKGNGPEVIPVKASRARLEALSEALEYIGDIKAKDEAVIYPRVSGKVIEKVKEDNSPIKKGEVIVYLDRDEVGLKFEKAPVESTLTGVVGRVYVDIGQNVTAQTAIALVVSMDQVKIDLAIPEKYLPKISLGAQAALTVDAYPQEEFPGRVTKITPMVDVGTRTAPVEISVDNPEHKLQSGMFATVKLVIQQGMEAPVILQEAVIGKEPHTYVYVIENNKAVLKQITLGLRQGPYYEVKEGLKAQDLVVTMGQQRLSEGAPVNVEIEE
ncbi:MAG: hypothetical protein A3G38_03535 [Omnitrophica WOR_2 bacterium RIFCSPLOWO2_12_FULL_51_8]|nr:MAG: hypothetical protein A3G38_03535 [Omnitrophica WOR_2 bacterium RIFCSPLOWO2_12_FULL_51_8]